MLRQVGAIIVRDMDELLDVLVTCYYVPAGSGPRVAILAGPGGPAVSASDACEENGLTLAQLSLGTQEVLRGIIPGAGTSVRNPVDMGMVITGTVELYHRATEATASDPNVDALLVIGGSPVGASMEAYAATIARHLEADGHGDPPFGRRRRGDTVRPRLRPPRGADVRQPGAGAVGVCPRHRPPP